MSPREIRALVVDDSPFNRRTIAELLGAMPNVTVVGKAADGDEALRLVQEQKPDLITLDLEMPRMDGFTFLRLLMARRPTPVIVVSGYSAKENVFRALELGALDFVAKPTRTLASDLGSIGAELAEKVELVRLLAPAQAPRGRERTATGVFPIIGDASVPRSLDTTPRWLVTIAASTGGPSALLEVFARLPPSASASVVVAQHMPEKFTKTFAERLDRVSAFNVAEAGDTTVLRPGHALVCPGGRCIEVVKRGTDLVVKTVPPASDDAFVPSGDRLFASAARAHGRGVIALVLTGMGDDGARGALAVRQAGGTVLAESAETAVVYGMPGAAERTGVVARSLPLKELADHLARAIQG